MKQFFKYLLKRKFTISFSSRSKCPRVNDEVLFSCFDRIIKRYLPEGGVFVKTRHLDTADYSLRHFRYDEYYLCSNNVNLGTVRICRIEARKYGLIGKTTHFKKIK